jgi:heme-degrading monooxygenase HmoA
VIGHHADSSGSPSHFLRVFVACSSILFSVFSWMKTLHISCKLFLSTSFPDWMELIVNSMQAVQKGRTTMYARVITTQYQPGKMEEGLQNYREMLSAASQQPGFKGILGLVDPREDKAMSISLWETEAEAQASGTGSAYFQEQLAKFAAVFAAAPMIETYEVAVQE